MTGIVMVLSVVKTPFGTYQPTYVSPAAKFDEGKGSDLEAQADSAMVSAAAVRRYEVAQQIAEAYGYTAPGLPLTPDVKKQMQEDYRLMPII